MTSLLLACTDEDFNATALQPCTTHVIESVEDARAAFRSLLQAAEQKLMTISQHSQEIFVEESDIYGLRENITQLHDEMEIEFKGIDKERRGSSQEYEAAQREFERLCTILREYDSKVRDEPVTIYSQ